MTTFFLLSLIMLTICIVIMGLCFKHNAMDEGVIATFFVVIAAICAGCSGALIALKLVIQWIAEAVK